MIARLDRNTWVKAEAVTGVCVEQHCFDGETLGDGLYVATVIVSLGSGHPWRIPAYSFDEARRIMAKLGVDDWTPIRKEKP